MWKNAEIVKKGGFGGVVEGETGGLWRGVGGWEDANGGREDEESVDLSGVSAIVPTLHVPVRECHRVRAEAESDGGRDERSRLFRRVILA